MTKRPSFRPDDILASPEKRELVGHINDAAFNAAVGIWKDYYDGAEAVDRQFMHGPARHSDKAVYVPAPRPEQRRWIRGLIRNRDDRLRGVPADINRQAKAYAMDLHVVGLKLCDCRYCKENR